VLFDSGARVEAEAFFRRALELDRRDPRLLNNLGFLLLVDGRPADAVVHLEQAARLDPTDRRAFNNLGFAYGALGDDRRALESFRAAVDEAGALANLGLACERRGDAAAAAGWYGKALALSPRHPLAFEGMERLGARPPIEEKNP
jgi:Flp pilus assembly protein TadD